MEISPAPGHVSSQKHFRFIKYFYDLVLDLESPRRELSESVGIPEKYLKLEWYNVFVCGRRVVAR